MNEEKKLKKKKAKKLIMNVSDTKYEVVRYVGRKIFSFKLTDSEEDPDWDLFWTDRQVDPSTLGRMKPYQRINHFPGMSSIARKNQLGRNLMKMKKKFPNDYKYFPQTWLLPADASDFKSNINGKRIFIVKPEASCQGKGIFLTKTGEEIDGSEPCVAQLYIDNPLLVDGLKFDLRIYTLIACCDPLIIYLFDDGLARFATETYQKPKKNNMDNICMHLTNYAVNKDNPNFIFNEDASRTDVGHKRSLKALFEILASMGANVKKIQESIKEMIIKTICSVQPMLKHNYYSSSQKDISSGSMCFEILGLDIMLDSKFKPWLLEVNHTPSFTTDTPFDREIKVGVISEAISLMEISLKNRKDYAEERKNQFNKNLEQGKSKRVLSKIDQEIMKKEFLKTKLATEKKILKKYERIFPKGDNVESIEFSELNSKYMQFMEYASTMFNIYTDERKLSLIRSKLKEKEEEQRRINILLRGPRSRNDLVGEDGQKPKRKLLPSLRSKNSPKTSKRSLNYSSSKSTVFSPPSFLVHPRINERRKKEFELTKKKVNISNALKFAHHSEIGEFLAPKVFDLKFD